MFILKLCIISTANFFFKETTKNQFEVRIDLIKFSYLLEFVYIFGRLSPG